MHDLFGLFVSTHFLIDQMIPFDRKKL